MTVTQEAVTIDPETLEKKIKQYRDDIDRAQRDYAGARNDLEDALRTQRDLEKWFLDIRDYRCAYDFADHINKGDRITDVNDIDLMSDEDLEVFYEEIERRTNCMTHPPKPLHLCRKAMRIYENKLLALLPKLTDGEITHSDIEQLKLDIEARQKVIDTLMKL